VLIIYRKVGTT